MAWLRRAGRLALSLPVSEWRSGLLSARAREVSLDGETVIAAAELADFHKKPADRLIVATALGRECSARNVRCQNSRLAPGRWSGSTPGCSGRQALRS